MELSERDALTLWRSALTQCVRTDLPDLTARQQAVLLTVGLAPGPHTVRGLAEHLDIAKPAVTRALDTLTRFGLVRRVKDENDLRNIFVERTVEGANYMRALSGLVLAAANGYDVDAVEQKQGRRAA